ncbi:MAG: hypothetical protein IJ849_09355 [Selenomonadaceae bacterium]|nr:hypothetical protein [Selenomonadaceae bacterium]
MNMRYRWFANDEDKTDELGVPKTRQPIEVPENPRGGMSRGETSGVVLSALIFLYAIFTADIPLAFVTVSYLLFELRRFTHLLGEPWGNFMKNLLGGFSVALFVGAIGMMLF